jgi:hypothetical protein
VVTVRVCPGTMGLPAPRETTVASGQMVELALECDTGIR